MAKAIYGAGTDLAQKWSKQRRDELDEGNIDDILAALQLHVHTNQEARKCLQYIARNQNRTCDPEFRQRWFVRALRRS